MLTFVLGWDAGIGCLSEADVWLVNQFGHSPLSSFSRTTEGDPHAVYLKEARLPSRSAWPLVAVNPSGAVPAPTGLRHTAEFILS